MNVYKKPGTAITAVRNGSGNEAAYMYTLAVDTAEYSIPVAVSAQAQTTKGGVSRVLLKVVMAIPRNLSFLAANAPASFSPAKGTEDITLHCVLTSGPVFQMMLAQDAQLGTPATKALQELVGVLVALLAGKDSVDPTIASSLAPLKQGLAGMWPLDVESGVYGAAA